MKLKGLLADFTRWNRLQNRNTVHFEGFFHPCGHYGRFVTPLTLTISQLRLNNAPPIFVCENKRNSHKIMHCVKIQFFLVVVLKIWAFFAIST